MRKDAECLNRAGRQSYSRVGLVCAALGALVLAAPGPLAQAEVRLPHIFGDNMVLHQRQKPVRVWGGAEPGAGEKLFVRPARRDRIETPAFAKASAGRGDGCSVAASAAVAPVALRVPSATAAGTLPMATVPPYSRSETLQRMGTR
jgi:hypothetical protein